MLDEETAWALVKAAAARSGSRAGPGRVRLPDRSDLWLDVHATGLWEAAAPSTQEARELLDLYVPLVGAGDFVVAQLGQSLDGRIATETGESHYITGSADIRRLHRLRALADAVIVGARTVELDDPRLTVREVEGENPVRVVLDPRARLESDRRVLSDGAARTILMRGAGPRARAHELDVAGSSSTEGTPAPYEVVTLPVVGSDGFDPAAVLDALRARGLRRVLVEGGGVTVSRFLQAGLLDRLHVTVAPLLIGSGRPALTLPPIETLAEALRPRCRHVRLGEDLLFDLDLR